MKKNPGSVFKSQEPVLDLQREIFQIEERLKLLRPRLEQAIAEHREQIRRSLSSKDPEELDAARGVATYWQVTKEDKQ